MLNKKRIFAICLCWLFTAVSLLGKFDKNFSNVERVLLLSVKINKSCLAAADKTKYANINFIGEDFRKSFLEYIQNTNFTVIIADDTGALPFADELINKIPDPADYIYLSNNFAYKKLEPGSRQSLMKSYNADAALVINITTSVWQQSIKGTYTFYGKDKKVLWEDDFEVVSGYIIADPASPYISEYDRMYGNLRQDTDFKSEIIKIYRELGKKFSENLVSSYRDLLDIE
ncbi:MAG TPA: hypothetical protein VKS21_07145 [Spirochaetota bacterium]|nr:hypothetical protein [Spirochaetota bacterium]